MVDIIQAYNPGSSGVASAFQNAAQSIFGNQAQQEYFRQNARRKQQENEALGQLGTALRSGDTNAALRYAPVAGIQGQSAGDYLRAAAAAHAKGLDDPAMALAFQGAGGSAGGTFPGQARELAQRQAGVEAMAARQASAQEAVAARQAETERFKTNESYTVPLVAPTGETIPVRPVDVQGLLAKGYVSAPAAKYSPEAGGFVNPMTQTITPGQQPQQSEENQNPLAVPPPPPGVNVEKYQTEAAKKAADDAINLRVSAEAAVQHLLLSNQAKEVFAKSPEVFGPNVGAPISQNVRGFTGYFSPQVAANANKYDRVNSLINQLSSLGIRARYGARITNKELDLTKAMYGGLQNYSSDVAIQNLKGMDDEMIDKIQAALDAHVINPKIIPGPVRKMMNEAGTQANAPSAPITATGPNGQKLKLSTDGKSWIPM